MLYLAYDSDLESGKRALKIGYSSDIKRRLSGYKTHSIFSNFLDTREGNQLDELCFHIYLKLKGYQNYDGTEWFEYDEEIRNIFKTPISDIRKEVWLKRNEIWINSLDFRKEKFSLYMDLFEEFKEDFNPGLVRSDKQFARLNDTSIPVNYSDKIINIVNKFFENGFNKTGVFRVNMKLYCEFMDTVDDNISEEVSDLIYYKVLDNRFKIFYKLFGSGGCRAVGYEEKPLTDKLYEKSLEDKYTEAILNRFNVGERYTKKNLKSIIREINNSLGVLKTAKATDLSKYFKLTKTTVKDPVTGKFENGFKLRSLY